MKKYISLLFVTFLAFTSCEEDLVVFDTENGQSVATFANTTATLPVPEDGAVYDLNVEVTTISDVDRSIVVEVDDSTTALPAEYTIDNSSLVIPAGQFVGTIRIQGNFNEIPDLTTTTLVLNLSSVAGGDVSNFRSTFSMDMFKQCPSELAGTYNVLSTGASTDGGTGFPTVNDFPYEVEIAKTGELNYTITDGVAGVYIEWYSTYGYTFETEGNFLDVCGSLSGSWVDAFGSTIVLTGTVNADGTLTISWENGFGDSATAIYTRQ